MSERRKCDVRHDSLLCGKGQDVICPTHVATAARCDKKLIRFIDLFAGCGGLSEGFIRPCCPCGGEWYDVPFK